MTTYEDVTPETLNSVMEFEHVIRVSADGTVSDSPESPYIELALIETEEGHWEDSFHIADGWQLLTGFSGQYGYSGPVMHTSEYIGGGMARHILETPGDYVAVVVEPQDLHDWQPPETHNGDGVTQWCRACGDQMDADNADGYCQGATPAGWAVAFKPLEEA